MLFKSKQLRPCPFQATQQVLLRIASQMTCRVLSAKHADWSCLLQGANQVIAKPSTSHRLQVAMNQFRSSKVLVESLCQKPSMLHHCGQTKKTLNHCRDPTKKRLLQCSSDLPNLHLHPRFRPQQQHFGGPGTTVLKKLPITFTNATCNCHLRMWQA